MPVYAKFVFHKNGETSLVNNKKKIKKIPQENVIQEE